eukprot:2861569-Rhodomonas_salina.1
MFSNETADVCARGRARCLVLTELAVLLGQRLCGICNQPGCEQRGGDQSVATERDGQTDHCCHVSQRVQQPLALHLHSEPRRDRDIGVPKPKPAQPCPQRRFVTLTSDDGASRHRTSVRTSALHLVDLAGSERQKEAKTVGARLKEANNINKSLVGLSCASAIALPGTDAGDAVPSSRSET